MAKEEPQLSPILNLPIHIDDLCLVGEALGVYENHLRTLGMIGIIQRSQSLADSIKDIKRIKVEVREAIIQYEAAEELADNDEQI